MDTPPIHRVDAEPRYIQTGDPAFAPGYKRALKEFSDLLESDGRDAAHNHVVAQYVSGRSRFDLSTISDYIDGTPVQWVFRILPISVLSELKDIPGDYKRAEMALRLGLKRVDGPSPLADIDTSSRSKITDSELERIGKYLGHLDQLYEIGNAVLKANEHMRGNEGKRSGS